jgi:hypothetical protein
MIDRQYHNGHPAIWFSGRRAAHQVSGQKTCAQTNMINLSGHFLCLRLANRFIGAGLSK